MSNGHWPFYLKIDGEILRGAMISRLEIRQQLGDHSWCELDFRLLEEQRPPIADYLGKPLQFLTFEEYTTEWPIFDGFVLEAELEYGLHGDFVAKLRAVTKSYFLQLTPEEDYFYQKDLREVAEKITGEDGVTLEFSADGELAKMNYVQWGESDFDFLRRLADDQGCVVRPTATGIEIQRGFHDTGLTLAWHADYGLTSFSLKGKLGQPKFEGTCYDPRTMESRSFHQIHQEPRFFPATATEMIEAVTTQSEQLPSSRLIFDGRAPKLESYQKLLEKESARAIGATVTAVGVSRHVRLLPGDKVHLEGSGFDAQGDYGLIQVIHRYDQTQGYRNEFLATPWMDYTHAQQPVPSRISGVVPARVASHNDPRGMGRVQIQYDWMEGRQTAWARMSMPNAGAGRGIMFMPEIGDEVLVTFEHGDPERPYIIGAVWNGVASAPRHGFWEQEGTEAVGSNSTQVARDMARNDIKRIVTKSGNMIEFVDVEGKESLVLTTPGGQKIQMLDHCIETGGRQILCLDSPGDILINAKGRLHMRSQYFSREVG